MNNTRFKITALRLIIIAYSLSAYAQFNVDWYTVDGGGATSRGGVYSLFGSIGQPDGANPIPGGRFTLTGGFGALQGYPVLNIPAPEIGPVVAPLYPVEAGTMIAACATFTNECWSYTAVWDWGDGITSAGIIQGNDPYVVAGTHVYSTAGVYTVRVSVSNLGGHTGEQSFQYVVVYDPSAGFVSGAGWIWSPEGALHPGVTEYIDIIGRANFGFVAKYQKGANTPMGNTEFRFKAGDLKFNSTEYQWLVVAGARAQFKGWGTLNGQEGYGFILTGIDTDLLGGDQPDRFRIKIWDIETDTVVYDNQPYTDIDDELNNDGTLVQGGVVVIHTKKK